MITRFIALSVILTFFSCSDEKPDNIIYDVSGTLFYFTKLKLWAVHCAVPGTIDCVDIFVIEKIHDKNFLFEEGKQISFSGICYWIPFSTLADKGIELLAGRECYYIKITDLKYEN